MLFHIKKFNQFFFEAFQNIFKPFSPAEFIKNKVLIVLHEFWFTVLAGLEVAVAVPGRPVQHMSAELRLCDDAAEQ